MKTDELIEHLKGFKSPSKQQQLLIELADKAERSKEDERKYVALVKAELTARKAALARSKVSALMRSEEKKLAAEERKARNHRLIMQGTLIDLAGVTEWSRGEIVGALLAAARAAEGSTSHRESWKRAGDALLAEREKRDE